tara:strand:- start:40 stop:396 length:357 start_codon:yes stop_codon:yes gene_type:complete
MPSLISLSSPGAATTQPLLSETPPPARIGEYSYKKWKKFFENAKGRRYQEIKQKPPSRRASYVSINLPSMPGLSYERMSELNKKRKIEKQFGTQNFNKFLAARKNQKNQELQQLRRTR